VCSSVFKYDLWRNHRFVKINANDLGMTRPTGAHLLVGGVLNLATAVTRNHIRNTG
jgi:hypothetical protein